MKLRKASHLAPWPDALALIALMLAGVVVVLPLFEPGYPSSWDGGAHFVRSRAMIELFLPKGHIDGWCPFWHNGFIPFVFYPNLLFFLLNGLIFYALGTTVSALFIFKLLTAGSWVLLPPAMYFMARCFRFSRFAAICAASCVFGVSAIHGAGLEALFVIGLIPNVFSLPLFLVALGTVHLAATMGGRYVPVAAIACSLVVAAHFISGVYLALACAVYVVIALLYRRRPARLLQRTGCVGLLTAGIFAMMWLPIFVYRQYMGPFADFGDFPFFHDFFRGNYLGSQWTNWLAVLFILGLRRWRFEESFLLVLSGLTLPFALGWIRTGWDGVDDFIFHILRFRGFAYLGLFVALFAGGAADTIRAWLARKVGGRGFSRVVSWGVGIALLCALGVNVHDKVQRLRQSVQVDAHHNTPEKWQFVDAYHWLRDHAPRPTVTGFDERLEGMGNPGYFQIPSRIVLEADRYCLSGNHLPSTRAHNEEVLRHLHDWAPPRLRAALIRYNVSHVLAWTPDVGKNLEGSGLFELVHRNDKIEVWEVKGHGFRFASGRGVRVNSVDFDAERVTWTLQAGLPNATLALAVAFHPGWSAWLNGERVPIREASDHLMELEIPHGASTLTIVFQRTRWETALHVLALGSFLLSVWLWARMRKRSLRA